MSEVKIELREAYAKKNKLQLIIGNGSERGDYVDCVELQTKFVVPHQGIMLMKTFYPNSDKWSTKQRISQAHPDPTVAYAWDYDYDDYHPLDIFEIESETLKQISDVKSIGADLHLTLTMDRSLTDDELLSIFLKLKPYGKIYLRINHEANGAWFNHNKKSTYKEVSDFFVRCHELKKIHTPNIKTVFSLTSDIFVGNQTNSLVTKKLARLGNDELGEALAIADYWSIDKYVSLNWGWPHTYPKDSDQFFNGTIDSWWRLIEETYLLMISMNQGRMKPLFLHEFNSDADVVGAQGQADAIIQVYERILNSDLPWLEGICFYQYGDYGGLGLVRQNMNEQQITPSLNAYQTMIRKFPPLIEINANELTATEIEFNWENAHRIKGVQVKGLHDLNVFTNKLNENIYLVDSDGWNFLTPKSTKQLNENHFCIFIPPFMTKDSINYINKQENLKEKIQNCLIN